MESMFAATSSRSYASTAAPARTSGLALASWCRSRWYGYGTNTVGTWLASASATLLAPARLSASSAAPHARPISLRNGSTSALTPARA